MDYILRNKEEVDTNGYTTIEQIYSDEEVANILAQINNADKSKDTFRKSNDLFAIRQFLHEIPTIINLVFNNRLKQIIQAVFGENYFVTKSIYFDKPASSNWYVAYHQDLTISVDKKVELPNFGPWTNKQNQFAVQPPLEILQNIYTIRIHLDDTDEKNGALKVIKKSHLKNIYRLETIDWNVERENVCPVGKGGIMIMKPLLLHSSGRTTNNKKRRVIHIEFSSLSLPKEIQWAERVDFCQNEPIATPRNIC